jgi:signal transduction histidine kinase
VVIDPARIPLNDVPPPVYVEELLAGGRSLRGPRIELPPGAGNWEIRFTALSLIAPKRVRFRYRLQGFDEDWLDSEGRRSAFYTQVPPGEYTFEVHASNNDGVWNDTGDRLQIRLAPRFHQTRLFAGLVALSLVLLGASGFALRVRGLHQRRRELERQVEERTHALREQQQKAEDARQESERQRELAQRANAVKGEMLSIAAHDLKNPLQLVIGHAEMAQLRLQQAQPLEEFIDQIHSAARRMLGILDALLDAAALDSEEIELKHERVDLAAVTRRVVETSRSAASRKGQELGLDASERLFVTGDPERLAEVVDNLVGNAIKYSPLRSRIEVCVREASERALVEVIDNGPGLSDEDKQKLFGRFQRLSAQPTAGESSTGLGLSIAKRLAELQGGQLLAFSEGPGKGSRFTLSMPRSG